MAPRDAATHSERDIELVAGDALHPGISEKTPANLATLLIACLRSRDGLSARLGGNIRAAGTFLDLLRGGLLRTSLVRPQLQFTLLHLPLLWSALYG
jgi:hypothetical protein